MFESTVVSGQIYLGKQGEHHARKFSFQDVVIWKEIFGEGRCELLHQRNGESAPYPIEMTIGDGVPYWCVSEVDTAIAGEGKCEVRYIVDDVVVKSNIYTTFVQEALGEGMEEPPEPAKPWVDQVLDAAEDVKNATTHQPTIGENGNWFVWDAEREEYGDTGVAASVIQKGEAENSLQQEGAHALNGISLSDKEINFVSFDSTTNVLTLNTDDTFFDYNSIFAFRIANLNERTYVDIVRVIESRKVGDNWEFTVFSPIEELNLGTPHRLLISAIINDESVVSKNNISFGEESYSADVGSLVAGYKALALAKYSLALGWGACAGAHDAIALGHNARAIGNFGVAIGSDTLAAYCSFAGMAFAKALGDYSVSFGWYGNSLGDYSFTANNQTEARAKNSSAFGLCTVANAKDQFVNGRFNIVDENKEFAEITGNGKNGTDRSNARTLDWQGNEWLAGRVRVGEGKELLPTEKEVKDLLSNLSTEYANSIKNKVSGNLIKLDDVSPLKHKIKIKSTTANKVIAMGENLLDLTITNKFYKSFCTVLDSNSVQANLKNNNYIALAPLYLKDLLQELDGHVLNLSTSTPTDGRISLYVSYVEGGNKQTSSNPGGTSVVLKLDHQGRTIKEFEIRLHRKDVKFTDTETIIKDIQLKIDDTRTDFVKPYSEIYQIADVVNGECEVDSLGTVMTIVPDSTSAEVEVEYNTDTKKYVDNTIGNIEMALDSIIAIQNSLIGGDSE